MQKIALLFFLSLALGATEAINEPIKTLETATKNLKPASSVEFCSDCMDEPIIDFRPCMRKICGTDGRSNQTYMKQYLDVKTKAEAIQNDPSWEKHKKTIDGWAKLIEATEQADLSDLENGKALILAGKGVIHEDLLDLAYMGAMLSFSDQLEIQISTTPEGEIKVFYDKESTKVRLPPYVNPDDVFSMYQQIIKFGMKEGGGVIELREKHPGKSMYEMLSLEIIEAVKVIERIKKNPSAGVLIEAFSGGSLEKIEKQIKIYKERLSSKRESINDYDIKAALSFILGLKIVADFGNEQSPITVDKRKSRKFLSELLKDKRFLDDLSQLKFTKNYDNVELNVVTEVCKTAYLEGQVALDGVPVKQSQDVVTKAKSAVLRNMASRLSKHSMGIIGKYVANIHFSKPLFPEEFKESFDFYLKEEVEEERELGITSNHPKYGKSVSTVSAIIESLELIGKGKNAAAEFIPDTKFDSIKEFCSTYSTDIVNDWSLSVKSGQINVSWNSIRDPSAGHGIVSHEIGHSISGIFKNNKNMSGPSSQVYSKARECLTSNNSYNKNQELSVVELPSGASAHNDGFYTEEDWADSIEAVSGSDYNTWCFFVQNDAEGNYLNENLDPRRNDTHSSSIFRLLNIEYQKRGTLPVECNLSHLREKGIEFKRCL